MSILRLGFIPLSDCAVLAVAQERGFFRRHGIEVVLSREVSWANIRDKVAVGALDGAQMLAGMPLAAAVGIDPVRSPLITAFSLGLNGNAITVSNDLWARMLATDPDGMAARPITAGPLRRVIDADRSAGRPRLRFAVVYPFATHNYELRYWLAAAGIDPDRDVQLTVVPPPRMVNALAQASNEGCCVGEPWNSVAVRAGVGRIVITKYELWNNSPEKVLAIRRDVAERQPEVHHALLGALLEAAVWTDAAENREHVAHLLADDRYIGAPASLLTAALTGCCGPDDPAAPVLPDFLVFHRYAANFPWTSHAMWLLIQMLRWGQLTTPIDVRAAARRVYRPDVFRRAAAMVGILAPDGDEKTEGMHADAWHLAAGAEVIAMGPDQFFDGRTFDPAAIVSYLAGSPVLAPSVQLDALAALNM